MNTFLALQVFGLDRSASAEEVERTFLHTTTELTQRLTRASGDIRKQIELRQAICSEAYSILVSTFAFNVKEEVALTDDDSVSDRPLLFQVSPPPSLSFTYLCLSMHAFARAF